jgi:hypothetical protein
MFTAFSLTCYVGNPGYSRKQYVNARQCWQYAPFRYQCGSWAKSYRAIYTRPECEHSGQNLLEFARPDNIILTNMAMDNPAFCALPPKDRDYWLDDRELIFHHHRRGADELPHRGLKDFAGKQLPFKPFRANQAYYYLMLLSFFLFETFKEDSLDDILPATSYATTIRRKLIDIAGKIVRTGHQYILKLSADTIARLKSDTLWERCQQPRPIPIPNSA